MRAWSTSSCRSTPAMSWPAGCACTGAGLTAAPRHARALPSSSGRSASGRGPSARAAEMAELAFDCLGAHADRYAVAPSMAFTLRISDTSGQRVEAIALRCQIRIEPSRRRYSAAEAERLRPLQFTNVAIMVPRFTGSIELDLPVMLSYDLEIGSTRYFAGLDDGEVPLLLLFSGTVFGMTDGRLQAQQVPWSKETAYRLPIRIWREAVDAHFPNSAWIKMSRQTL